LTNKVETTKPQDIATPDITPDCAAYHAAQKRELSKRALELNVVAETYREKVANLKNRTLQVVAAEKNDDGKPTYSNTDARATEVVNRLEASAEYKTLVEQIYAADRESGEINRNYRFHSDMLDIILAFAKD
jgi:hypothetical protein